MTTTSTSSTARPRRTGRGDAREATPKAARSRRTTKPTGGKPTAKTTVKPEVAPGSARGGTKPARTRAGVAGGVSAPPRTPFVLLVIGLLAGALVSLLLLNTVLAQDAFTLSRLRRGNRQLTQRKQALQEDISREEAPAVLARKARALGMVPVRRATFVDAETGRVVRGGVPPKGMPRRTVVAVGAAGVIGAPGAVVPIVDGGSVDRPTTGGHP